MSAEVRLRPADVRGRLAPLLERWHRRQRAEAHPPPVALYGTSESGGRDVLDLDGVLWTIIPVRSELELRAELVEHADDSVVFLVDHADKLPLDLACRLLGQRVHPVDRISRLAHLFGARSIAPGFESTVLAEVLLLELPGDLEPISGTLLQPDDAWLRYAGRGLGLELDRTPTPSTLLAAAVAHPQAGADLVAGVPDDRREAFVDEGASWLERTAGSAAPTIWRAWTGGGLGTLLAWTVHIDAARRAAVPAASTVLRQALRHNPQTEEAWGAAPVAGPLCVALNAVLAELPATQLLDLVRTAVDVMDDPEFAPARRASPWLPEGFEGLQDELAEALARIPDMGALEDAKAAFDRIDSHRQARADAEAERRHAVREAGLRLACWLVWAERDPRLEETSGPTAVRQLARWFNEEGGLLDWCREDVRTHRVGHEALDGALARLLDDADALRRDLDRRFAAAVVEWDSAGKQATDVVPIERVTRDVVAPFLESPGRRLLMVVMDGMSVDAAERLLEAHRGWAPVQWAPGKHRDLPPAIAVLPTLTSTSRAALFAGFHKEGHGDEGEGKDTTRFLQNKYLAGFVEGVGPQLFLKAEVGSSGQPRPNVLKAIEDEGERVVAVVVNAIDEQLKGSDQVAPDYSDARTIPVLGPLLDAAGQAERAVLLVSDHGHIPAQRMTGRTTPDGTADSGQRYRTLRQGEAPQEGEIEAPPGCWTPRGSRRVALLVDERRCWGHSRHGAHGGLTLAEAVVPMRLVARSWLWSVSQPPDDGLRTVQEVHRPRWWRLELAPSSTAVAAPAPQPTPRQASLFTGTQTSAAPAPPKPPRSPAEPKAPHALTVALKASGLFVAKAKDVADADVQRALDYVDALAHAGGAMSREAFARAVGTKTRKLPGRIAQLGFLHSDGFTVLEHDVAGNQVRLHIDRLRAQYNLEG